jgi:tetratricopeptide (TPR) repeat protein
MTTDEESAVGQGVACLNNGAYDLAIARCDEAIKRDRTCAAAFYLRAIAYRARGDYVRAAADFEQAQRLAPAGSVTGFKDIIKWDLNDATAFFNRGSAYHNEGDRDRAINNYSEAIRLNPKHASVLLSRAVALQERDRNNPRSRNYDERFSGVPDCHRAIDDYRKVLSLDADSAAKLIAQAGLDTLLAAERAGMPFHKFST